MAINSEEEFDFQQWRKNKINDLKYHRAICMMICGSSLDDVAKTLGTTKRTVQRFFESEEFNTNLSRAMHLTFKSSLSKAAVFADRALDILMAIAEDVGTPVRYRLTAIHQIFEIAFRGGLNKNTNTDTITDRLDLGARMLAPYNTVRALSADAGVSFQHKLNIENEKLIWTELYPDEPFPREEEFRQWFKEKELN